MERYRKLLKSKIHRATVTHADLNYEGSITLSPQLIEAADLIPYESVHVWNVTRGTRFETYCIEGLPHSKEIAVNGAAAHLVSPGDIVIIASFTMVDEHSVHEVKPILVFVDEKNQIKEFRPEVPGPFYPCS